MDNIPENEAVKGFLDFHISPPLLDTTIEEVLGPPPPPCLPPLPVFNICSQPGGYLNSSDAVYIEAASAPPPVVPAQPMFNSYAQTLGNLNTANPMYMESVPATSHTVPAQTMFNIYPQTMGTLNTANPMYIESVPATPMQLMAPPAVYSQAAPPVYGQCPPSVYGQSAPSVFTQAAPVFHQSYGQNTMQPDGHLYNQAVAQSQGQVRKNKLETKMYVSKKRC